MQKKRLFFFHSRTEKATKAMLLAALCFPVMAQEELKVINLTFAGRGESDVVESVTVTNLSHPEIEPVTMSGTDILSAMGAGSERRLENKA